MKENMEGWIIVGVIAIVVVVFVIVAVKAMIKEKKKPHHHHHAEEFVPNTSLPVNENFLLYMHDYARDEDLSDESKDEVRQFFEEKMEKLKEEYIKKSTKDAVVFGSMIEKDLIEKAVETYVYEIK